MGDSPRGRPEHGAHGHLGREVMKYLEEHPHAMDTLQGIAEWWIGRDRAHVDLVELACALDHLTTDGALERIGSGEAARYRLKGRGDE